MDNELTASAHVNSSDIEQTATVLLLHRELESPEKNIQKNASPSIFEDGHELSNLDNHSQIHSEVIITEQVEETYPFNDKHLDHNQVLINQKNKEMTWKQKFVNIIHLDMIPTKVMYFFWGGLIGTFYVYLYPFFVSMGITESKAGVITGTSFAVTSLTGPLWGVLTDYTGRQKVILTIICGCSSLWVASFPIIGAALSDDRSNSLCNLNLTVSTNTTTIYNNTSKLNCSSNHNLTTKASDPTSLDGDALFYIFLFIMATGAIFFGNLQGYMEAIALNAVKVSRKGASYGGQRLFGSLGVVAANFMTGALVDNYQFQGMSKYSLAFFVYAPFPVILIPLGYYLIHQYVTNNQQSNNNNNIKKLFNNDNKNISSNNNSSRNTTNDDNNNIQDKTITTELLSMFSRFEVILFMSTALVAGLAFNQFVYFTMLLIQEKMTVSFTEASFIMSGFSISSIVMFPLTGLFIKFLRGPIPAIILGMFCHCLRNIVMAYTNHYNMMLGVQVLHCFDFALLWSAMMDFVHDISPPSIKVTMNVVLQSVHFGLGTFLVNMVGGVLCQQYGAQTLFLGNGVLCGVWTTLLVVYYGVRTIIQRLKNVQNGEDESSSATETAQSARLLNC